MIVRHTRPRRPTEQRVSEEVLKDLLMALRGVVDSEKALVALEHSGDKESRQAQNACAYINQVSSLYRMLESRGEDLTNPLAELSEHTGLNMQQLLADCLEFPHIIPYVRDLNGLRRTFLCYCGKREAADHEGLGLCIDCLESAFECVKEKRKLPGFVLYRAYSPEVRCRHADFNTVLVTLYQEGQWPPAWCEMCLIQEKQRIRAKHSKNEDNMPDLPNQETF